MAASAQTSGSSTTRPTVDVVVPFAGRQAALDGLLERLAQLTLQAGDTLVVVDNRPAASGTPPRLGPGRRLVRAPGRRSSYFARNRGARLGQAPWILFMDADVVFPHDLIDRYFVVPPATETGILAGGVSEQPPEELGHHTVAARYRYLRQLLSQEKAQAGPWAYAVTANCAVRRTAFEQVGGFVDDVRSGGDVDLSLRIRSAGWGLDRRETAGVRHLGRTTLRGLLRQAVRYGAGVAWVQRRHPGFHPAPSWRRVAADSLHMLKGGLVALTRRDGDGVITGFLDPLRHCAFEIGRLFSNHVPPQRTP